MRADPFAHEGLFYRSDAEYVASLVPFVLTGLSAGEPVLVAVPGRNLELIQTALGPADARRVWFRDMAVAGRNPGRITPTVLFDFVTRHAGTGPGRVRIIGEPLWAGRTEEEYPYCVQHEALINVVLAGQPATVLCPYDATRLGSAALADARATHPVLVRDDQRVSCPDFVDPVATAHAHNRPLPEPPGPHRRLVFGPADLPAVRELVAGHAYRAGLATHRVLEFQLAVHEIAVNSIEHTPGRGTLRVWFTAGALVCEISDSGHIADPLAGRRPPDPAAERGRGLLLAHCLCDLVQIHTEPAGTAVRLHVRSPGASSLN